METPLRSYLRSYSYSATDNASDSGFLHDGELSSSINGARNLLTESYLDNANLLACCNERGVRYTTTLHEVPNGTFGENSSCRR